MNFPEYVTVSNIRRGIKRYYQVSHDKIRRTLNKKEDRIDLRLPNRLFNGSWDLLPNDELTLKYKVGIFKLAMLGDQESHTKVPENTLSSDFNSLLNNSESADVTLTCEGEQFKAHQLILTPRSPVFAEMLKDVMKEQKHDQLDIVDMEKDVLKEMLKYIYTDKTDDLEKLTNGLLAAADKYALERLRILCEQSLAAKLSIENDADTLITAHTHSADQPKKQTIQFMKDHKAKVTKTSGWKRLVEERKDLISEFI